VLRFDVGNFALKSVVQYVNTGDIRLVDFLSNYADTYGLPQPAAL